MRSERANSQSIVQFDTARDNAPARVHVPGAIGRIFSRALPTPANIARSYAVMQERLRATLDEVEQKRRQLKESEDQVIRSRDFLQSVIDSLDDDMMVLDQWFHIVQANRSLSLKHSRENVIGRYCYEITHASAEVCRPPNCQCPMKQVLRTGLPARVVHVHPAPNGGGQDSYIEVSASPLRDATGKVVRVVELMRDVTDSKEQEKRIIEANQHLLALNDIASTVSQSLSLDFVLAGALQKALERTGAEAGGILLADEKSRTLSYVAHRGLSDNYVAGTAHLALGEGISGKVAQTGVPLVVEDMSRDPRSSRKAAIREEGLKSFVAVPLRSKKKTVGVLTIASRAPGQFSTSEAQLLGIFGNQLGVAIENARLYRDLETKERNQEETLRRLITAQEDERRRVARELHDVTSQALATLAVRLEAAMRPQRSGDTSIEKQLADLKPILDETSKEVHRLIYDLRPSLLDDLGLPAAVRSCAHNLLDTAGVEAHVEVVGQESRLSPVVEIAVFRIVQEAITNIASHARAESAYISLEFQKDKFCAQVEDDGIGFDARDIENTPANSGGMGLLGMRERAELLGGTLEIQSEPEKGTRVVFTIPFERSQHG